MEISNGLMWFLQEHVKKLVIVNLKEGISGPLSGHLVGFDNATLLLNHLGKDEIPSNTPMFIDLKSVCVISSSLQEDLEKYVKAFEDFRKEYEASQREGVCRIFDKLIQPL
jgi:hypothetical protein